MNRICLQPGCGAITPNTRCARHATRAPDRRPSSHLRGYDRDYQRKRAEILTKPVCVYCGKYATTVDHRVPLALGGTNDRSNLVACCAKCNYSRGARLRNRGVRAAHYSTTPRRVGPRACAVCGTGTGNQTYCSNRCRALRNSVGAACAVETATCSQCGASFVKRRQSKTCSAECNRANRQAMGRAYSRATYTPVESHPITCVDCGATFVGKGRTKCDDCVRLHRLARRREEKRRARLRGTTESQAAYA